MRKRLAAEFLGTFLIVLGPCMASFNGVGLIESALVSGLAVLTMVCIFGPISGAHFNPAVTLAFVAVKRFPRKHTVSYILAQIGGAILAGFISNALFGSGFGVHVPKEPHVTRDLGTEVLLTFVLMSVIMAVATDRRVNNTLPCIAIGFSVVFGVLVGGPITGGSMNPARSLGPALFGGSEPIGALWLYFLGPIIGAVAASHVYEQLRTSPENSQSVPNDLIIS